MLTCAQDLRKEEEKLCFVTDAICYSETKLVFGDDITMVVIWRGHYYGDNLESGVGGKAGLYIITYNISETNTHTSI